MNEAQTEVGEYWVYVLRNPKGQFYTGHTENLEARLESHNRTNEIFGKFTRKNGPWELVWKENHATRSEAVRREREIKGWKSARMIRVKLLGEG